MAMATFAAFHVFSFLFLLLRFFFFTQIVIGAPQSYVVYMGQHSGGMEPDEIHALHHGMLASVMDSDDMARDSLVYSYKHHINGFSALLEPHHVDALSEMGGVVSVFPNRANQKLHTTRSWEFLGLEDSSVAARPIAHSLWTKSRLGQGVIIGVMDTGVWPESESFNDSEMSPIPKRWKGICEHGPNFTTANCNRKLIGARYFVKGAEAAMKKPMNFTVDLRSPRDVEGHGSHTASTAGGSRVGDANEFGFAGGVATGGAPYARIAVYKVCWQEAGCFDADILAAFDAALADGVDVFSLSLGSAPPLNPFFSDAIAIGSFHAIAARRSVICSAGNDGPIPASVSNVAPWIFTIAASSIDRNFPATVRLFSPHGAQHSDSNSGALLLQGYSLSNSKLEKKSYPLVLGEDVKLTTANESAGRLCFPGSLDPKKVKGKIVACIRGVNARVEKGAVVKKAGGVGFILLNKPSDGNEILSDPHVLPASHLSSTEAHTLLQYINTTRSGAAAFITYPRTQLNSTPAPQMASFSSQGPNSLIPDILKPDITAPGLNILAAWTGAAGPTVAGDSRRVKYNVISGTSMSCPHVSGLVALLRAVHPSWSPAAIKSALMTTATRLDNTGNPIRNGSLAEATPFNYGSGHVDPNRAMDPGLVYDTKPEEYVVFMHCALGYNATMLANTTGEHGGITTKECHKMRPADLNYPSVSLHLNGSHYAEVQRTVTFVGGGPTFNATINPSVVKGIHVQVFPSSLTFSHVGQKLTFHLRVQLHSGYSSSWTFAYLQWTDRVRTVTSPIAIHP